MEYLTDKKNNLLYKGDNVFYYDANGGLHIGKVTRIRVEVDHKVLCNACDVVKTYMTKEDL